MLTIQLIQLTEREFPEKELGFPSQEPPAPEVRNHFTSDMGFVVDFLNEGSFEKRREQKIIHVNALCEMMRTLMGDNRFTDLAEELAKAQEERRQIVMCEYIDMFGSKR